MPVEFLTDEQAAAYAAYRGAPSRTELERFFFLDDADRELIESKRRAHNRLGYAAQLTTTRYLGVFLDDPADVPVEVVDHLAEQLGIGDPSVLNVYGERENTRLEYVRELRRVLEYREFAEAEAELRAWVDARAWTTGEGPKALFDAAAGWLRERRVMLPGVTTLTRLVATTVHLTTRAVDDALDLLEVLIATKLLAKAERETVKEKMKTLPRVERASGEAGDRIPGRVRHHERTGRHRHPFKQKHAGQLPLTPRPSANDHRTASAVPPYRRATAGKPTRRRGMPTDHQRTRHPGRRVRRGAGR
ncbi:DUF4158 domain-containing protein [Streptomyces uncialis]|nr:DUF4158 domain-containing protein [Streptomyces uncialis]MCX4663981.1 DUF4158 domain-containing protein [Streptomyces uncialis]